jgi:hypothetical protein
MTVERRFVVGLADIRAITLECVRCGLRLTMLPDNVDSEKLGQCPACRQVWLPTGGQVLAPRSAAATLVWSLKGAREEQADAPSLGVRVLLEFEEPAR